ncbi:MAG: DEAD/DEAH box helicase [Candidatus Lokiarchaeota archaeon]|nr:DEAD/DEAH box helicase [Candidatus Lokiarchaeota archaeon]
MEKKLAELIDNIKNSDVRSLVYSWEEDISPPEYAHDISDLRLDSRILQRLEEVGIEELYIHQYEAIKKILNGLNVMLLASTGSGKTEAFLIPIISECLNCKNTCNAILIFPTKALSQDQMERINALTRGFGISAVKYDGDTPKNIRREIFGKNPPNILITNPDMLHKNLRNDKLKNLISSVKYIVLDEVHNYSGVFGSSVHYIIKRLKRFLTDFQFICSSATINNPKKFIETLFQEKFEIIKSKKILRGKRIHLMIAPHHSKYSEAVYLTKALSVDLDIKTLVFTESHLSCELLKKIADFRHLKVGLHRAGITKKKRMDVRKDFKNNKFNAIVCTPTLELGIDIGDLRAVINLSIPPTFNRYLQRIGRAGRSEEESIDILLIGNDPISNYFANHPTEYYNSDPDPVYIDIENPVVMKRQLISMIIDEPLDPDELYQLTEREKDVLREIKEEKLATLFDKFYLIPGDRAYRLFNSINIRGSGDSVIIKCKEKIIGKRQKQIAIKELYEDAIYMSGGTDYKVEYFDRKDDQVRVKKLFKRRTYYTKALYNSNILNFQSLESQIIHDLSINYGTGDVKEVVDGYMIKDIHDNKKSIRKILDEPLDYSFRTKMIYFKLPLNSSYSLKDKIKASHTVEHVLIHAGITLTGADQNEIGGVSYPDGSIFIHDGMPGGSGVVNLLFHRFDKVIVRALEILQNCHCVEDGCPNCTFSHFCGSNNDFLSKSIAIRILKDIIDGEFHEKSAKIDFNPLGNPIV